jgi:hypothetical protein
MKITLVLFVGALIFTLFAAPLAGQVNPPLSGESQWSTQNGLVAPGQTGVTLQVTVTNTGTYPLENVKLTPLNSSPLFLYGYANGTPSFYVGELPPGSTYTFPITMSISPFTHIGVYDLKISSSFVEDVSGVSFQASQTIEVPVQVLGYVQLSVTTLWGTPSSPLQVFPGEQDVPLTLIFQNSGTVSATNVTAYLRSTFPVAFNQTEVQLGVVPTGGETEVQVLAAVYPNATVGTYEIPITIHYFHQNVTLNGTIVVGSNMVIKGSLFSPQWATVGQQAGPNQLGVPLQFDLIYLGSVPTLSEEVIIHLPRGFTNSTGGNYVDLMEPSMRSGDVLTLSFSVNIGNLPLGIYNFPVQIVWYVAEGNGLVLTQNQSAEFSLYLPGEAQIQFNPINSSLVPGEVNKVPVLVINNGTGPAYNISLTMQAQGVSLLQQPKEIGFIGAGGHYLLVVPIYVPLSMAGEPVLISVDGSFTDSAMSTLQLQQSLGLYVQPSTQLAQPLLGSTYSQLTSGSTSNVTVSFINRNPTPLYNVTLTFTSTALQWDHPSHLFYPLIAAGATVTFNATVTVPPGEQGVIPVQVTAQYYSVDGQPQLQQLELTFYVQPSTQLAQPLLGSTYSQLTSGSTSNVTVSFINRNPTPLYNVTLTFTSTALQWDHPSHLFYPLIAAGATVTFNATVTVPPGEQGVIPVQVTAQYYSVDGQPQLQQLELTFYVQPSTLPTSPIIGYLDPSNLSAGSPYVTNLIFLNTENSPLYNISIEISDSGIYINQTLITVPKLSHGQQLRIPISVFIPVAGSISMGFQAQYYQQGELHSETGSLSALASGSINIIQTQVSTVPAVALPGSLVSITATIVNYGTGTANGLLARVITPLGLTALSGSTYYVGNVAPYTPTTYTFALAISNNTKPGTYEIPVILTYTNSLDQLQTSKLNLTLTIGSNTSSFGLSHGADGTTPLPRLGLYVGIIVVVVVVIAVSLWRWVRRT